MALHGPVSFKSLIKNDLTPLLLLMLFGYVGILLWSVPDQNSPKINFLRFKKKIYFDGS